MTPERKHRILSFEGQPIEVSGFTDDGHSDRFHAFIEGIPALFASGRARSDWNGQLAQDIGRLMGGIRGLAAAVEKYTDDILGAVDEHLQGKIDTEELSLILHGAAAGLLGSASNAKTKLSAEEQ